MQTIAEIMSYAPMAVTARNSLKDALDVMNDARVAALPVHEGERLVGIVTEDDIRHRANTAEQGWESAPIEQVMTREPVWCHADQSADEVLMLMTRHAVRHIPVLDRNLRIEGIVSLTDMANRVAGFPDEIRSEAERVFGPSQLASKPVHGHRTSASSADGRF